MRFAIPYTITEPANGDLREVRRFAWGLVRIGTDWVLWERYKVLQVYHVKPYVVKVAENKDIGYKVGSWVDLSKTKIN